MGRDLHYRPGSFYRTDDRTGFPTRAERTRKEWNGYIVGDLYWEARQPQDLVRGVPDYQAVPEARPLAPNTFVGPLYFETAQAIVTGQEIIYLEDTAGINIGDKVGLMMDSGIEFITTIQAILAGGEVSLLNPAPGPAASGNLLVDYRIPGDPILQLLATEGDTDLIVTEDGETIEIT